MDRDTFTQLAATVFEQSNHGSGEMVGHLYYTNDGVIAAASEETGRIGFGVVSGLTPTAQLLTIISGINRLMTFGHYWLAPGSNENDWALVCGFKIQYDSSTIETVGPLLAATMRHNSVLIDAVKEELAETPYTTYWDNSSDKQTQAFALVGQLA